ncbi:P450 monooxygenase No.2 [Xylariaceae sp. FL0662B]|nr:P450 monooxygenase No.2 [Xylariaceae sp. FL0662B]
MILLTGLLATVVYAFNTTRAWFMRAKGPVVGYRSFFEPGWLLGFRFTSEGKRMIQEGYEKFKNGIFKVRCNDTEIVVLSHKYVDEIRSLPEETVSSPQALYNKGLGNYTGLGIILESRLHVHALQQRLTPTLTSAIRDVKDELDYALDVDLPECTDRWVSVDMHSILARLISRLSSRVFAGTELSRNEEWLTTSTEYPENAFATTMSLRMVPVALRPLAALLLPRYWQTRGNVASGKRVVGGIVRRRRAAEIAKKGIYEKPNDLLQWMMDSAEGQDGRPDKLGHRLLFVSDASVMTTSLLTTHCIYDLMAHPQYFEPIREEILSVLRQGGSFQKVMLHKMVKLDSCLKESQRLSPPFLMTFDRVLREPLTLSDGTRFPTGTHLAMPTDAILRDPEFLPAGGADPDVFDPFRYSRAREKPENAQRYQLATTEVTSLPFGHGKHACPGRFFAASEAKLILCHLLLRYDFRYPEGQSRPRNLLFSENLIPDPSARVLIHKRETADRDLAALAVAAM